MSDISETIQDIRKTTKAQWLHCGTFITCVAFAVGITLGVFFLSEQYDDIDPSPYAPSFLLDTLGKLFYDESSGISNFAVATFLTSWVISSAFYIAWGRHLKWWSDDRIRTLSTADNVILYIVATPGLLLLSGSLIFLLIAYVVGMFFLFLLFAVLMVVVAAVLFVGFVGLLFGLGS